MQRFDQVSRAMPWSGHALVTEDSRVPSAREEDSWHRAAKYQKAAELLTLSRVTRIDIRRKDENGGKFDVNPKPNLTGAGFPDCDEKIVFGLWLLKDMDGVPEVRAEVD
ncbi:hypothetical protein B9Z19DRAFT_1126053 [Tuber borchii]|uniref:Uncharacterized protein n=1 Tax=Tuber borchii TaxID=42251 RepID=A0A2T6ZTH7_TUBBO|nr:hypothetical protein B9Z19DRAFT_1126053 [Tuber borchii]